jgi:hypothetical protein
MLPTSKTECRDPLGVGDVSRDCLTSTVWEKAGLGEQGALEFEDVGPVDLKGGGIGGQWQPEGATVEAGTDDDNLTDTVGTRLHCQLVEEAGPNRYPCYESSTDSGKSLIVSLYQVRGQWIDESPVRPTTLLRPTHRHRNCG